ncbi:MAG: response regulator transcription factor [Anaerolineae bacterium]|nr:response regulator transcription factor [Anaerolineae bacterium]
MTRIFIIYNHLMFGFGLVSLLAQNSEIEVLGYESNGQRALEQIKVLKPDVVILDEDEPPHDTLLLQILKATPTIKVIGLSLHRNDLFIYQARQHSTADVDDLVGAIEDTLPFLKENDVTSACSKC